ALFVHEIARRGSNLGSRDGFYGRSWLPRGRFRRGVFEGSYFGRLQISNKDSSALDRHTERQSSLYRGRKVVRKPGNRLFCDSRNRGVSESVRHQERRRSLAIVKSFFKCG